MTIDVYRKGVKVETLTINDGAKYTNKLMGENSISFSVSANRKLNINPLDYITWKGVNYTLWDDANDGVVDGGVIDYDYVFYAPYYNLYNKKFRDEGTDKFSYSGYTSDFLKLLITNIISIDAGWRVEELEDTEFVTIEFSDNSCYTALVKVCEQLKLEFDINNKIISVKKRIGQNTAHKFAYGKGNGLYEITRDRLGNSSIITVLEVFGGTTNMPVNGNEDNKRLRLSSPLERNISIYGKREGSVTFDHIFPRLKDKYITAAKPIGNDIDIAKEWEVSLGIDFDLNTALLSGLTPQIQFQSGELKGVTFDLSSSKNNEKLLYWNSTTKTCKIIVKEDGDYRLPSILRQPKVGDKFVLLNMSMDDSYKTEALAELKNEGEEYLTSVCATQFVYTIKVDPRHIKKQNISLAVGDKVRITDKKLGIDASIRTSIINYPLVNPNEIELTISDDVIYSAEEKIKVTIEQTNQQVSIHSDDIRYQYLMLEKNATKLESNSKEIESQKQELLNLSKDILKATLTDSVYYIKDKLPIVTSDFFATGGANVSIPENSNIINDSETTTTKTWSSTKIESKLTEKSDKAHTHANYSLNTHNHNSSYSALGHAHRYSEVGAFYANGATASIPIDLTVFDNRDSGVYTIPGASATQSLVKFKGTGSAAGLELIWDFQMSTFKLRGITDSNKFGATRTLWHSGNLNTSTVLTVKDVIALG